MKRLLVLLFVAVFTAQIPSAVPTDVPASIAVIDSGTNSSLLQRRMKWI